MPENRRNSKQNDSCQRESCLQKIGWKLDVSSQIKSHSSIKFNLFTSDLCMSERVKGRTGGAKNDATLSTFMVLLSSCKDAADG